MIALIQQMIVAAGPVPAGAQADVNLIAKAEGMAFGDMVAPPKAEPRDTVTAPDPTVIPPALPDVGWVLLPEAAATLADPVPPDTKPAEALAETAPPDGIPYWPGTGTAVIPPAMSVQPPILVSDAAPAESVVTDAAVAAKGRAMAPAIATDPSLPRQTHQTDGEPQTHPDPTQLPSDRVIPTHFRAVVRDVAAQPTVARPVATQADAALPTQPPEPPRTAVAEGITLPPGTARTLAHSAPVQPRSQPLPPGPAPIGQVAEKAPQPPSGLTLTAASQVQPPPTAPAALSQTAALPAFTAVPGIPVAAPSGPVTLPSNPPQPMPPPPSLVVPSVQTPTEAPSTTPPLPVARPTLPTARLTTPLAVPTATPSLDATPRALGTLRFSATTPLAVTAPQPSPVQPTAQPSPGPTPPILTAVPSPGTTPPQVPTPVPVGPLPTVPRSGLTPMAHRVTPQSAQSPDTPPVWPKMPPQDEAAHEPVATPARIAPDALASGPKAGSNRAEHGTTPVSPALLAVPIVAPDQIRLPQVGTVPPHLPATLPDLLAVPLGGAMKPRLTTRPAIATEGGAADRPDAKPIRPGGLVTPHAVPAPQPWPVGNSFWPQSLPPPIEPATRSVHLSHAPDRAAKPEPEQALPIPLTERPAPDVAVAPPAPAPDAPRPVTHHLTIAPPDLAPAAPAHGHAALPPKVAATLTDAAKRATTKDEPIELLLDPVELGKVRFELTTTGDRVQVNLSVERPETLDLLRRNVDMLRSELSAAGFDASTLSFGEWGKGAGSSAPQTATQFGDDAPDLPPAAIPAATKRSPQDQGLDLRL